MTARCVRTTLWLAGVVLSAISCREDQSTGPTDPEIEADAGSALAVAGAELSFYQVSPGHAHSCGLASDGRLYCWGWNRFGEVGDGTRSQRLRPVPVATDLRFRLVSTGTNNTCAVTTDYRAYCWGRGGSLGDGTTSERLAPVAVAGGRLFVTVDTYDTHTCGLSYPDRRAYCWGSNSEGQLGDGTMTTRLTPVAVATTLRFHQVTTGGLYTCGLATDNRAYCWGNNRQGQLGDRTEVVRRTRPGPVADGHLFRQLDAGDNHTCAVRTDKRAFCWGNGRLGELGNGHAYLSFWPRLVAGGHSFDRVSAGVLSTCGETTTNRAYCWGDNDHGTLGDGTSIGDGTDSPRLRPTPVAGGHFFSQVSVGNLHACGRTETGVGYCWGDNRIGQLGDGTTERRPSPARVAGTM